MHDFAPDGWGTRVLRENSDEDIEELFNHCWESDAVVNRMGKHASEKVAEGETVESCDEHEVGVEDNEERLEEEDV